MPARDELPGGAGLELELEVPAPFRLDLTAWALRRRPHNAIDRFDGEAYRRALPLGGAVTALEVRQVSSPDAPRLAVRLPGAGERSAAEARAAVPRLLGLGAELSQFFAMAAPDPLLGPLVARMRGMRPPRFPTVFEALVNAIACQQLSLVVGIHVLNRLTAAYGEAPAGDGDLRAFPAPEALAAAEPPDLRQLGLSFAKARAIVELSGTVAGGRLDLEALAELDDQAAAARLMSLHGIGRWSAEYVLLRGLGRLNVFPGDDVGARKNLARFAGAHAPLDYEGVHDLIERWQPWASLVYFHLLLDSLSEAGLVEAAAPASPRND